MRYRLWPVRVGLASSTPPLCPGSLADDALVLAELSLAVPAGAIIAESVMLVSGETQTMCRSPARRSYHSCRFPAGAAMMETGRQTTQGCVGVFTVSTFSEWSGRCG